MNVAQETLGLRRGSFSLPLSLLMSAFALPIPPENLTILLRRLTERSPTARAIPLVHSTKVVAVRQLDWLDGDKPPSTAREPLTRQRAMMLQLDEGRMD